MIIVTAASGKDETLCNINHDKNKKIYIRQADRKGGAPNEGSHGVGNVTLKITVNDNRMDDAPAIKVFVGFYGYIYKLNLYFKIKNTMYYCRLSIGAP